jgi:[ribosomal protein S5]-alanine N-acetyltransferase
MGNIQLVRLDSTIEQAFASDEAFMGALAADDWARVAEIVHGRVGRTLVADPLSVNELQWGGYFVVDEDTREVIGSCAFKSAPSEDGTVEIAYFTYPDFERRGYATQMARKLIELASGSRDVQRIVAHTLPEANASTRVLEKSGMTFVGEVIDSEDGRVWRWQSPNDA